MTQEKPRFESIGCTAPFSSVHCKDDLVFLNQDGKIYIGGIDIAFKPTLWQRIKQWFKRLTNWWRSR